MDLKELKIGDNLESKKVEEYLFSYMVNFYHLLQVLDGNGGKPYTSSYCTYLLSECFKDVTRALVLSKANLDDFCHDVGDSYDAIKSQLENVDPHILITTFNGESDRQFDTQGRLATILYLCEKKFGITWEDVLAI